MSRVRLFSNGTEFNWWTSENCDRCCRYSNVSSKRNNAKCKHAFDLDYACATDGMISTETALKIGTKYYNGMEKSCELADKCNDFNKPIIRKKYPKKIKNQTELFSHE